MIKLSYITLRLLVECVFDDRSRTTFKMLCYIQETIIRVQLQSWAKYSDSLRDTVLEEMR